MDEPSQSKAVERLSVVRVWAAGIVSMRHGMPAAHYQMEYTMTGFMRFSQGQVAVNIDHVVSIRIRGREDQCQIVVTDIRGEEYNSAFCKSFAEAQKSMDALIDAMLDD